jgi:hypothetical protein
MNRAIDVLAVFEDVLDRIFSLYFDATSGFEHVAEGAKSIYHPRYEPEKRRLDDGSTAPGHIIYALGDADHPDYTELSARTPKQIIDDNAENSTNYRLMAHACIVMAYQYWEDNYRELLADAFGIAKNDLKVPIFGDLRFLRRSIIHYQGRAIETKRDLSYFDKLEKGELLDVDRQTMNSIWFAIKRALKSLRDSGPSQST